MYKLEDKSIAVCMTLERTNYESDITASAAKIQQQISRKLDNISLKYTMMSQKNFFKKLLKFVGTRPGPSTVNSIITSFIIMFHLKYADENLLYRAEYKIIIL
jgi:hypothetical protein